MLIKLFVIGVLAVIVGLLLLCYFATKIIVEVLNDDDVL